MTITIIWYIVDCYIIDCVVFRFNTTNKKLQAVNIDLGIVIKLYKSLEDYLITIREDFKYFEEKGKVVSNCSIYKTDVTRKKKRNVRFKFIFTYYCESKILYNYIIYISI